MQRDCVTHNHVEITKVYCLIDAVLVLVGTLLAITVAGALEYYRQIRRVHKEYISAKGDVEDIVLSFNRELRREAEMLEIIAYKVEAVSSRNDKAYERLEEVEKGLLALRPEASVEAREREKTSARLDEIERKIRDVTASQETLGTKISEVEKQTKEISSIPEARVEAVIPIKREKALAPLTETELSVLEMLASEGAKTAPEIKGRIKLSREHTARLMKKIYEEGYLERDTGKIPYKYRIKKEMEKLLRKTETEAG